MVRNMTRKARKKLDADGRPMRNGQSRKRAMNRSILRDGWGGLVDKIEYKAEWFQTLPRLRAQVQGVAAVRTRMGVRTVRNPTRQGRERRVEHSRRGIAAQPRTSMTKEEEPADNRG